MPPKWPLQPPQAPPLSSHRSERVDMGRVAIRWALIACALALGLVELMALQRCRYQVWRSNRLHH